MMIEFSKPIPVVLQDGQDAYAIYCESGGQFENDLWTCVLCKGGYIRTFAVGQLRIHANATFNIDKINNNG